MTKISQTQKHHIELAVFTVLVTAIIALLTLNDLITNYMIFALAAVYVAGNMYYARLQKTLTILRSVEFILVGAVCTIIIVSFI